MFEAQPAGIKWGLGHRLWDSRSPFSDIIRDSHWWLAVFAQACLYLLNLLAFSYPTSEPASLPDTYSSPQCPLGTLAWLSSCPDHTPFWSGPFCNEMIFKVKLERKYALCVLVKKKKKLPCSLRWEHPHRVWFIVHGKHSKNAFFHWGFRSCQSPFPDQCLPSAFSGYHLISPLHDRNVCPRLAWHSFSMCVQLKCEYWLSPWNKYTQP